MEKGWKRLILVAGCLLFGCLLGYFVTVTQAREQDDPAYLAFFEERGLPVPEPAEPGNNIIGAGLLLGGVPTGLMLYQYIADQWKIHAGRKLLGVLGVVPLLIGQTVRLFRKKSQPERTDL